MDDGTDKFTYLRRQRMEDPAFADRMVSIVSTFDGDSIEIVVQDQGKGFLHADHPPIAKSEDNLSCFGRGLTLICNAVDEVKYGNGGSQVTLIKKL